MVSHNMNDVFEIADRIAVLYLGHLVAVRPAAEMDRQIVVDLMTTGTVHPGRPNRPKYGAGRPMAKVDETPRRPTGTS